MKRESISLALRFRVLTRDRFTCVYGGAHPPNVTLVIDHAQAVADGGRSDEENLVTACVECNRGKSDRTVLPRHRRRTLDERARDDEVFDAVVDDYLYPIMRGEFSYAYGGRSDEDAPFDWNELIEEIDHLTGSRAWR